MIEINKFEGFGRRLLVEFSCSRCKKTASRPLKESVDAADEYLRDLCDLPPPKEWRDGGFYHKTLCPECAKAYDAFMGMEPVT